jgi:hypothetical protein
MTVLAVEGLKVRCSDDQDRQFWFDTFLLERYHQTQPGPDAADPDLLTRSLHDSKAADDAINVPSPYLLVTLAKVAQRADFGFR